MPIGHLKGTFKSFSLSKAPGVWGMPTLTEMMFCGLIKQQQKKNLLANNTEADLV